MGYKILGFVVWHILKVYFKERLPSRRVLLAGAVGAGVAIALVAGAKQNSSSG